jgi:uncharacterized protein
MNNDNEKTPWYIGGLGFECMQCCGCCCGPNEGYVWTTKKEVELIAQHLKITVPQFRKKYTRKIGTRTSLLEKAGNKDCIFITETDGRKTCAIYSVRPRQCRTWPFWKANLTTPNEWNYTASKCPGINRGKFYTFEEINEEL